MSDNYEAWRERLASANDARFWPIEAIDAAVVTGEAQFWCDGDSAVVARSVAYPGGAVVIEVLAAAGDVNSIWKKIAPALEAYGQYVGADHIFGMGRLGWDRSSRPEGWERHMVIIMKDLHHEG